MLKKKRKNYILPSNEWVLAQCGKKLALMILNLHNEYIARKKRRERFDKAAPHIQKIVRGFLGITVTYYYYCNHSHFTST